MDVLCPKCYTPIEYDIKKHTDLNINDMGMVNFWISQYNVSEVYHLAALPGIKACEDDPVAATNINVMGTLSIAMNCYAKEIPFILASSFAVNGGHGVYADTKYLAEKITLLHGGRVCRIANVFGGKDYTIKKNTVVAKLMRGDFKLEGDGTQTRDFIHVDDVCKAMIEIIKEPPGIYEICSGMQTSINELVDIDNSTDDLENMLRLRYHDKDNRCWSKLV